MFELSVALRFLREGKIQTLLIVVGISVGIAVQIFLSALIGGLQKDLIRKTVGRAPHITGSARENTLPSLLPDTMPATARVVSSSERDRPVRNWEPVAAQLGATKFFTVVTPVAEGPGFMFRGERSLPVQLRGVRLSQADSIYAIRSRMTEGTTDLTPGSVIIGSEIARELRIKPGSTIRIATSGGVGDAFVVSGIFDLESKPLNQTWVIMPLGRAQTLLGLDNGVSVLEMQVPRVFNARAIAALLGERFPSLEWGNWMEDNAQLLTALQSQSSSSNLIQVLVLLAVALGIASVLAVSAIQKARQIGILKAIGATNAVIGRVFLIMGALLGFFGSIAGCFTGYGLINGFLAGTAKATGTPLFPLSISPSLFAVSIAVATVAGTLAAFIPARRSSRLNPIEVIRNG
ncbi:MAG: ABC transporter permease [Chitinispirillaceae bacterium]|nr:ABC transporter permease [Chitinispirillaceae bacterium]